MSFRIEEKLHIEKANLRYFLDWIISNNGKKIFQDRTVTSIYFDNDMLDMHHDGEEGVTPRKKIRLRYYSYNKEKEIKDEFFLEKKINSQEGRFKSSKKISFGKNLLREGIFEQNYGICKPKIQVEYHRSYFAIFNVRLTLDRNISSKLKVKDNSIIAELKPNKSYSLDYLNNQFPFNRLRFSKYSRAVLHTHSL